jgi:hypothetical protein
MSYPKYHYEICKWLRNELSRMVLRCQRPHKTTEALYQELNSGIAGYTIQKNVSHSTDLLGRDQGRGTYTLRAEGKPPENYLELSYTNDVVRSKIGDDHVGLELVLGEYSGRAIIHTIDRYSNVEDNAAVAYDILEAIPKLLERIPKKIAYYDKLKETRGSRSEKQEKVQQMRASSMDTWLDQVCKALTYPYALERGKIAYKLRVKISKSLQVVFQIPLAHFQKVIPTIQETIADAVAFSEKHPSYVMIDTLTRFSDVGWKEN